MQLAKEGINLSLAADSAAIHDLLEWLQLDWRSQDLDINESRSSSAPFAKLQVKIKPEIIRMSRPAIRPSAGRTPAIDTATFGRWLDSV